MTISSAFPPLLFFFWVFLEIFDSVIKKKKIYFFLEREKTLFWKVCWINYHNANHRRYTLWPKSGPPFTQVFINRAVWQQHLKLD